MVRPGRRALATLLTTLAAAGAAAAQTPRPESITPRSPIPLDAGPRAKGSATISGRVFSAESGAPLRGAEIRALIRNGETIRVLTTDAEGRYEIAGLVEGTWSITASKAGYIVPRTSLRNPLQPLKTVQLGPAQRHTLDFAMARGAAISGNVFDDQGGPVAGVRVDAVRARLVRGVRVLSTVVATDLTDDQGAYRLHSLPAGDYYISAAMRAAAPEQSALIASAGVPTYFPGTPSQSEALRLTLATGQERAGITFTVTPTESVQVSGALMSASGVAAQDVAVELLNSSDFSVVARSYGNFGMSQEGGRFIFRNVPPGLYLVSARIEKPGAPPEIALAPVAVGTDEVTGLAVAARRGTTITGTVSASPGMTLPATATLGVFASSARESQPRAASVDRKGTFSIAGLVGPHQIGVEGLPDGWMVESIDVSGQPAADSLVDLGAVEQMTARIVVTNQSPTVSGRVGRTPGRTQDVSVVVFPADEARWPYPSRFVRATRVDGEGRFRLAALPPHGQYLAVALEQLDESEAQDPEMLGRLRAIATPFALSPGERKTLDLPVVTP